MEIMDHMDVPVGGAKGLRQPHMNNGTVLPSPQNKEDLHKDLMELIAPGGLDDLDEEEPAYTRFDEIEIDDQGVVVRVQYIEYIDIENGVKIVGADTIGKITHLTDRPRIKREYRMSYPSFCDKLEEIRWSGPGHAYICDQQPTTVANRQKNAGDKPKFRTGRRMARRQLNKMEEATMCTG